MPPAAPAGRDHVPRPGDDGVLDRVRRRNTIAAAGFAVGAAVLLLTALVWPGWALTGAGPLTVAVLFTAALTAPAMLLAARARRWAAAAGLDPAGGVPINLGLSVPLHPVRPGQPLRRRLPARLLPARADLTGLRDGAALVLHARPDQAVPVPGERCTVAGSTPNGPFLVHDPDTGAVFAAERGLLAVL